MLDPEFYLADLACSVTEENFILSKLEERVDNKKSESRVDPGVIKRAMIPIAQIFFFKERIDDQAFVENNKIKLALKRVKNTRPVSMSDIYTMTKQTKKTMINYSNFDIAKDFRRQVSICYPLFVKD